MIYIRYILKVAFLLVLIVVSPSCKADGQDAKVRKQKPYSAKTVEECIHEKECVWYAFESLIKKPDKFSPTPNILKRREEDIHIRLVGDKTGNYQREVEETLKRVRPYLPFDFKIVEAYDSLVFFSDNFEQDIKK